MKFTFTIPQADIDKAYDKVVATATKSTEIKGFRKGKAPKSAVVSHIGQSKLQQQAIETALPDAYIKEVKKRDLKPIGYPNINLKKGAQGSDWEFEAEISQAPEVKLGDYQKSLKGLLAAEKIWTPGKGQSEDPKTTDPKAQSQEEDKKLQLVFDKLLTTVKLDLPSLLVEQETNRLLSRLIQQTENLGLKLDDYLTSTGQTKDSIKETYKKQAETQLKLEFILDAIRKDQKIEVTDKDIQDFIAGVGDENTKKQLQNPSQQAEIRHMLERRQTIQKLLVMAA